MAEVLIRNGQRRVKLHREGITALSRFVLEREGRPASCQLSLYFVNNAKIRVMNTLYLKRDMPTDVIAFSMDEGEDAGGGVLGDVVISTEQALLNAERFGASPDSEISRCLIHGILHLLGYDEGGEKGARMKAREEALLKSAGKRVWRTITC